MQRVEQGFPLEALSLSTCFATSHAVRLLSQVVVDVWGSAETLEAKGQTLFTWDSATRDYFVHDSDDDSEGDYDYDYSDGDDDNSSHTSIDDAEEDDYYFWKALLCSVSSFSSCLEDAYLGTEED